MQIINNRFLSLYDYNFLLVIEKIFLNLFSKICGSTFISLIVFLFVDPQDLIHHPPEHFFFYARATRRKRDARKVRNVQSNQPPPILLRRDHMAVGKRKRKRDP